MRLFAFMLSILAVGALATEPCLTLAIVLEHGSPSEYVVAAQAAQSSRFHDEVVARPRLGAKGVTSLPLGMRELMDRRYGEREGGQMYAAYEQLRQMMVDIPRFFHGLQDLERTVFLETVERGVELTTANFQATLLQVLARNERELGFPEAREVTSPLTDSKFSQMLAEGYPFNDRILGNPRHGALTHRIQLYVWSRAIHARFPPGTGHASMPLRLYRDMGNTQGLEALGWGGTGFVGDNQGMWYPLFDNSNHNFTSPGFLMESRGYLPLLGI